MKTIEAAIVVVALAIVAAIFSYAVFSPAKQSGKCSSHYFGNGEYFFDTEHFGTYLSQCLNENPDKKIDTILPVRIADRDDTIYGYFVTFEDVNTSMLK